MMLQDLDVPLWVSDSAQDFLSKTLVKDPAKRSTAADLVKHPWLKSLGLKPSASQNPSSIAVVEPVLQPRVVLAVPDEEEVAVSDLAVTEEQVAEDEKAEAKAASPAIEVAVTASGAVLLRQPYGKMGTGICVWCLKLRHDACDFQVVQNSVVAIGSCEYQCENVSSAAGAHHCFCIMWTM